MAYTTINKSTEHFNTKLYTGDGTSSRNITGVGFQPDLLWIKNRNVAQSHFFFDAVRGVSKAIFSNTTSAESTQIPTMSAFLSDGFTVGTDIASNGNGNGIASWNWKAGTSFSNSAGANGASLASTGSVNTDAGFSIISYSGTNGTETIAHGLGVKPKMIIFKYRNGVINWLAYHASLGATKSIYFDATSAATAVYDYFADTEPTSSVFTVKKDGSYVETNNSGGNFIAYCFADVQGYSKFGSYVGNGNADGSFIYTGFKPAFVIMKRTDTTENWLIKDSVRDSFNVADKRLFPNLSQAEGTSANGSIDILSNGFKQRGSDVITNASGGTYIYMAFAEAPLVGTNGVTAKAR
jgi:hypothetical protein